MTRRWWPEGEAERRDEWVRGALSRIDASDREPWDGAILVLVRRGCSEAVTVPSERVPAVLRAIEGRPA